MEEFEKNCVFCNIGLHLILIKKFATKITLHLLQIV